MHIDDLGKAARMKAQMRAAEDNLADLRAQDVLFLGVRGGVGRAPNEIATSATAFGLGPDELTPAIRAAIADILERRRMACRAALLDMGIDLGDAAAGGDAPL